MFFSWLVLRPGARGVSASYTNFSFRFHGQRHWTASRNSRYPSSLTYSYSSGRTTFWQSSYIRSDPWSRTKSRYQGRHAHSCSGSVKAHVPRPVPYSIATSRSRGDSEESTSPVYGYLYVPSQSTNPIPVYWYGKIPPLAGVRSSTGVTSQEIRVDGVSKPLFEQQMVSLPFLEPAFRRFTPEYVTKDFSQAYHLPVPPQSVENVPPSQDISPSSSTMTRPVNSMLRPGHIWNNDETGLQNSSFLQKEAFPGDGALSTVPNESPLPINWSLSSESESLSISGPDLDLFGWELFDHGASQGSSDLNQTPLEPFNSPVTSPLFVSQSDLVHILWQHLEPPQNFPQENSPDQYFSSATDLTDIPLLDRESVTRQDTFSTQISPTTQPSETVPSRPVSSMYTPRQLFSYTRGCTNGTKKRGNNPYGCVSILRCEKCRKGHTKVVGYACPGN